MRLQESEDLFRIHGFAKQISLRLSEAHTLEIIELALRLDAFRLVFSRRPVASCTTAWMMARESCLDGRGKPKLPSSPRSAAHRRIDFHHRRSAILGNRMGRSQQAIGAAASLRVRAAWRASHLASIAITVHLRAARQAAIIGIVPIGLSGRDTGR